MAANDRELERLINEKKKHKGEWLTYEACNYYREKAKNYNKVNSQDAGFKRELRLELQNRYGLLDVEAINILNGFYISFYVEKYRRIKECLPFNRASSKDLIEYEG